MALLEDPASSLPAQYDFLGTLAEQGALGPELTGEAPERENGPLREGAVAPGFGQPKLRLSQENVDLLGREYAAILDDHDLAMAPRWLVEEDIRAAYAQRPDPIQGGVRPGDARLVSETTMTMVDQATARIASNIMSVDPLIRVTAITGGENGDLALAAAKSAERFLNEYGNRVVGLNTLLPQAVHRVCKVGTAVIKGEWLIEEKTSFAYTAESPRAQERSRQVGRVNLSLIPNRLVKVWPPTEWDWSKAELVGHDTFLTPGQWRALAANLGLDDETTRRIENTAGWERDQGGDQNLSEQDIERRAFSHKSDELIRITELWCYTVLPGQAKRGRYQLFMSRPLREVFWIDANRFHSQRHPYFPVRYKYVDELAWGSGVGHEVLFPQAADSAMQNIRMDSLMSGCYWVVVRKPDYVHETQTSRPMHGQVIPSEDPANDFIPRKLGGEVPEIEAALQDVGFRAAKASGMPPVLGGLGDPIQKSGTGTGATVALIEQAGRKFGQVDMTIRADLTPIYSWILETVAQFAPEGVFYQYASEEDADQLQLLRYIPPRGEVSELFRLTVQAPNAATSREGRKQSWLLLYQFIRDHLQLWGPQAAQLLQSENPAAVSRLMHEILDFQAWMAQQIVEDYELPGAKDKIPQMPAEIPPDQVINQLQQALQQLQGQLQQTQGQLAQLQAPGPPMGGMGGDQMMGMMGEMGEAAPPGGAPGGPPGMPGGPAGPSPEAMPPMPMGGPQEMQGGMAPS